MTLEESKKAVLVLLKTPEPERSKEISQFQNFITKDPSIDYINNDLYDILWDLAWDLDFYEPNPEWRRQDPSFYGEEKLVQNIQEALQAIEELEAKDKKL